MWNWLCVFSNIFMTLKSFYVWLLISPVSSYPLHVRRILAFPKLNFTSLLTKCFFCNLSHLNNYKLYPSIASSEKDSSSWLFYSGAQDYSYQYFCAFATDFHNGIGRAETWKRQSQMACLDSKTILPWHEQSTKEELCGDRRNVVLESLR